MKTCVFIDSQNQLIASSISSIRPQFPPCVDLRELIARHVCTSRSNSGRSPNAFIIYRKIFVETARKDGYQLPMTIVSSMASKAWELEPEEVKEEYKRLAKEANDIRNKMIPKSCRKRKREKWNIVSFPSSPSESNVDDSSSSSGSVTKPSKPSKPIPKKRRLRINPTKESSPNTPPLPEVPKITFNIPCDIVSPIIDTFDSDLSFDDMYPSPFLPHKQNQEKSIIGEQSQDFFTFDDDVLGLNTFFENFDPSFWIDI